jgi:hypothetical protein
MASNDMLVMERLSIEKLSWPLVRLPFIDILF